MPTLPNCLFRAAAFAALLPLVSACAPARDQFPPACPNVAFLAPTADLAVFRPGSDGRDLTALMLAGRMQGIKGECHPGDKKGTVEATVAVGAEITRGPAMKGNQADVPIYVAVTEGDRILDKHVYTLSAAFPSNVDRVAVTTPDVFMVLPVSQTKSAAAYSILAGFQLTAEDLATSRGVAVSPEQPPPAQQAQSDKSASEVPLQSEGGVLVVPVSINNAITLKFVIDSGAADVSIPADVVSTLVRTGTIRDTDFLGRKTYTLADGSTVPSATFRIRVLKVGDHEIENVTGSIASRNGEPLLGQSFLKRFKSWHIDNERQVLLLN